MFVSTAAGGLKLEERPRITPLNATFVQPHFVAVAISISEYLFGICDLRHESQFTQSTTAHIPTKMSLSRRMVSFNVGPSSEYSC